MSSSAPSDMFPTPQRTNTYISFVKKTAWTGTVPVRFCVSVPPPNPAGTHLALQRCHWRRLALRAGATA